MNSPEACEASCEASPNNTEDKFTPNTLSHLNNEIKANASNLDNLD